MTQTTVRRQSLSRRALLAGTAGAAALGPVIARAQQNANLGTPATVISSPPRDFAPGHPSIYPDPDVVVVDPSFLPMRRNQGAIYRVWTGALWAEGPAWSSQGRYVVFSDVSGNVQYRYIWDDGRVTPFRRPSYNSNGNTFDFQGRQISCEHFNRRVIRWEHDGSATVIADSYDGKPLNSPNDVVPHPDGSIWFTDPPYGGSLAEGHPDEPGGPGNPQGIFNPRIGAENPGVIGGRKRELSTNVYRWDPSGRLEVVITEDQLADPNGICFSPDYKTLYVISTGKGPGDAGPGGTRSIYAFEAQGAKVANMRLFTDMIGRRGQMRAGRHARRCHRQFVVQLQCAARLCRRAGIQPCRQADRAHSTARSVRQFVFRRSQARPPVHGCEPVALHDASCNARRCSRMSCRP